MAEGQFFDPEAAAPQGLDTNRLRVRWMFWIAFSNLGFLALMLPHGGADKPIQMCSTVSNVPIATTSFLHRTAGQDWGLSSAGRAPDLHSGGQEFDPPRLHHLPDQIVKHLWALNRPIGRSFFGGFDIV